MGKRNDIEQLAKKMSVVDVTIDDEDSRALQHGLSGAFKGWLVVVVEIIKTEHAISTTLEGNGTVRADKASGARDEHGDSMMIVRGANPSGGSDPLLPRCAAPGGGGAKGAAVDAGGGGGGLGGRGEVEEEEEDDYEKY